ncbi:hypothetical protein T484DRAFT_1868101, partial [Baffinella frigidus]
MVCGQGASVLTGISTLTLLLPAAPRGAGTESLVLTTSFGGVSRAAPPIPIAFFRQPVGAALFTSVAPSSIREGEVPMVLLVSLSNFPRLDDPVDPALVSFRVGGLSGKADQVIVSTRELTRASLTIPASLAMAPGVNLTLQ